ncbi:unnamed protein product [Caenorhabditis angaria]|uniref:Potassium channel domain-containing protein n=1 Tax=Caenorhabditis angaria TaxID=860376 RepID=A0A9P1IB44_9PELO|nr:unnamed protein product [Caenorhabditis angaria]
MATSNDFLQMLSANTKETERTKNGLIDKYHLRPLVLHIGLIVLCIGYAIFGALLFLSIERPVELAKRERALFEFDLLRKEFIGNITEDRMNSELALELYTKKMMIMFEDAHTAHTFEYHHTDSKIEKDLWTFSSALVFTTTTVIPVGYGYIYPITTHGKMLLIVYALLGIPLTLVTMADTGKFASQLVSRWFGESMAIPATFFVCLLFAYPMMVGFLLHQTSDITFLDSVYFSLTSIFTIGFGDLTPDINVVQLVIFVTIGVILVTITVDFVAVELIDHVHYMGRHVGKAKELAGKMFQLAQNLNMKSGIANGVGHLHVLARFGMLSGAMTKDQGNGGGDSDIGTPESATAFAPDFMEGIDFMDTLSTYSRRSRHSAANSARNLFVC